MSSLPLVAASVGSLSLSAGSTGSLTLTEWSVFNVMSYGAAGDGVTTDTSAIQAAIDDANNSGGGIVYLPANTYLASGLTHGTTAPIAIVGAGSLGTQNGATTIKRLSGTDAILTCTGTGQTSATRSRITLSNLTFDGNGTGGSVVRLSRCNEVLVDSCRFRNTTGNALWASELWNSRIRDSYFTDSGTTTTSPAVLLDAVTGAGTNAGCSTVTFVGCEWENNAGTGLKISGSSADSAPSDVIQVIGGKFEHSHSGTYPVLDLDYVQNGSVLGVHFSVIGVNNPVIHRKGTSVSRFNKVVGCSISHTGAPTYLIDQTTNGLVVANNNMTSSTAPTAFYHIGSGVAATGAAAFNNLVGSPDLLYADDRTEATAMYQMDSSYGFKTLTYSASITPNMNEATAVRIVATDTNAFTINNPTNAKPGQILVVSIANSSGGALGAITWDSQLLLAGAFTNPANGKKRTITFVRLAQSQWAEIARAAADIN